MVLVRSLKGGIELGTLVVSVTGIGHVGHPVIGKTEGGLLALYSDGFLGLEAVRGSVIIGPEHQVPALGLEPEFVADVFYFTTLEDGRLEALVAGALYRLAELGAGAHQGAVLQGEADF